MEDSVLSTSFYRLVLSSFTLTSFYKDSSAASRGFLTTLGLIEEKFTRACWWTELQLVKQLHGSFGVLTSPWYLKIFLTNCLGLRQRRHVGRSSRNMKRWFSVFLFFQLWRKKLIFTISVHWSEVSMNQNMWTRERARARWKEIYQNDT